MAKKRKPSVSPVPSGMYIELNIDVINDGDFKESINRAIQRGLREYLNWENASDRKDGCFEIHATLRFSRIPNSQEHFIIEDRVKLKVPDISHQSTTKVANGLFLCQPEGTSMDDPDQIRLFDSRGRAKANLNLETGELIEETGEDIAGKVGTA